MKNLFLIILVVGLCFSGDWYQLDQSADSTKPEIDIIASCSDSLVFDLTLHGFFYSDTTVNSITYSFIDMYGFHSMGDSVGKPNIPMLVLNNLPPCSTDYSIEVEVLDSTIIDSILVFPLCIGDTSFNSIFYFDTTRYSDQIFYPRNIVIDKRIGTVKFTDILSVKLTLLKNNPGLRKLIAYNNIRVKYSFNNYCNYQYKILTNEADLLKKTFFDTTMCNSFWDYSNEKPVYLILTTREYISESGIDLLKVFCELKRDQGYNVKVHNFSDDTSVELPPTESEVKSVIEEYFEEYEEAFSYVLLVGDPSLEHNEYYLGEEINTYIPWEKDGATCPTNDVDNSSIFVDPLIDGTGFSNYISNDYWYSCLGSEDLIQDISIGRFSVNNAYEFDSYLVKVLGYNYAYHTNWEPMNSLFYQSPLITETSTPDALIVENIFNRFIGLLSENAISAFDSPESEYYPNLEPIISAYNLLEHGCGFHLHLAHGNLTKWADADDISAFHDITPGGFEHYDELPSDFSRWSSDLDLENLNRWYQGGYPIVFSASCLTGNLSVKQRGTYIISSFGEMQLLTRYAGASAFIGSSNLTYRDEIDNMALNFLNDMYNPEESHEQKRLIGDYLLSSEYMYSWVAHKIAKRIILGDPAMDVWTSNPKNLNFEITSTASAFTPGCHAVIRDIYATTSPYKVTVTDDDTDDPLQYATVTVSCGDYKFDEEDGLDGADVFDYLFYESKQTDASGEATFTLPMALDTYHTFRVAVTRHNYRPKEKDIPIGLALPFPYQPSTSRTMRFLSVTGDPGTSLDNSDIFGKCLMANDTIYAYNSKTNTFENVFAEKHVVGRAYFAKTLPDSIDTFYTVPIDTMSMMLNKGVNFIGGLSSSIAFENNISLYDSTANILMNPLYWDEQKENYVYVEDSLKNGLGYVILSDKNSMVTFPKTSNNTIEQKYDYKYFYQVPTPPFFFDDSNIDISISTNTVTISLRDNPINLLENALIICKCSDTTIVGYTDSIGEFSDPLIGKNDSTHVFVYKPGYIKNLVYPYDETNGNETFQGGDVHLHGDLIIPAGDTLTIKAGTHVMFEPSSDQNSSGVDTTLCEIMVRGHLRVEGTSDDSVYFEAAPGGSGSNQWYGITIDNGGSVDIEYAKFTDCKDAIYGHTGTDKIIASNLTIEDANIMADFSQGSTNKTIQLDNIVSNCDVAICGSDANSWVKNSSFDGTQTPITVAGSSDTLHIFNCDFESFGSNGIMASNSAKLKIENCSFKNGASGSVAISLDNSTAKMYSSLIDSCDVGVYAANGSVFWAGDTFSAAGEAGNIIQNCSSYLIRNVNSKSPSVYCQNVFWGDSAGPNLNLIDESGADVFYYPWTGYSKYNCNLPTVHCVPCEFDSIQDAVDAATSSTHVVYIQPGTYTPNSTITVNAPMTIAGESETSTIIDGQGIQRIFNTTSLSSGNDIYVSDLKIYDGYESSGSGYSTSGGAGWRINQVDGTVHFDNVIFESCSTYSYGGAIWAYESPLEVNNSIFKNNGASLGCGSIESRGDSTESVTITNSTFYDNTGNFAGAIRLLFKNYNYIENNVIYDNFSLRTGNLTLQYTKSEIYHNTFFNNEADLVDGALTLTGGYCDSKVLGNLFHSNIGITSDDLGVHVNSTYDFMYNLLDTTDVYNWSYVDVNIGNFDTNPYFADETNKNLRLADSSDCIDASPDTLGIDSLDIEGTPRDSLPDIGAYEYPDGGYGRATTEWNDPTPDNVPTIVELGNPVPNPFNSTVSIDFLVREESDLVITIHDINGKLIRTMIDENVQSGHWATTWDGRDNAMNLMTSGVYFIKLNVNGRTVESKSVTLIK